jgi:hypothetical protein
MTSKTKSDKYRCIIFITTHGSMSLIPNPIEIERTTIPHDVKRFKLPKGRNNI